MKSTPSHYVFWLASLLTWPLAAAERDQFLKEHCYECHDADTAKGGLNLQQLSFPPSNADNFARWVKIHDRVASGEMPPAKKPRPETAALRQFTNSLAGSLIEEDRARIAAEGRATKRRLNRYEYEETLRDLLLAPYLEVKAFLPEDSESHGFNKIGDALDVSYVQMSRYLAAADFALRQVMAPQVAAPETLTNRYYTWEEREFFGKIKLEGPLVRRTFPLIGLDLQTNLMAQASPQMPRTTDPHRREKEAMAVVVSTYEPTEIRFGSFRAPISGRYKLRFSGYSVWMGPKFREASNARRSEPVSIYAEVPPRTLRKLGSFDFDPEPAVRELDVWLLAGETIRPDAARFFRSRPPNHQNPLATAEGMPGVAFSWMEVEGPIIGEWPPSGHQLLFGKLPLKDLPPIVTTNRNRVLRRPGGVEVQSENPGRDSETLLRAFIRHAYRRPVPEREIQRFLAIIQRALANRYSFTESMIAGYTGVLSSPGFLYFEDKPGRLDDWALAERLSYFLWNSAPDDELRRLAQSGSLRDPLTLRQQTDRMLNDFRSQQFVSAFLDYWLDLRFIAGTAPDEMLYPDYQLDDLLWESMIDETRAFFSELIHRDLGVTNLIDSSFSLLNERLALHYGIPGVEGVHLRPVKLPDNHVRGGLLTQGSILKVTANGTTTSPVKRGAWILSRIVGKPPQSPPPGTPAVEPDIRGASTIREQLARHRDQESCQACHRHIDPPGFALENFDVMGGWRENYRSAGDGEKVKGIGHNGNYYTFALGPKVDASGETADGSPFADIRQFKECLLKEEEQVARNLSQQLAVYATGSPIHFSDRPRIAKILANARNNSYGVRTLIHELVQSELFLNK